MKSRFLVGVVFSLTVMAVVPMLLPAQDKTASQPQPKEKQDAPPVGNWEEIREVKAGKDKEFRNRLREFRSDGTLAPNAFSGSEG